MKNNDDAKNEIIEFINLYYKNVWENDKSTFLIIKPIMIITIQDLAARFLMDPSDIQKMRDSDKSFNNIMQNFINTNLLHFYSTNKFKEGIIEYAKFWSATPDDIFKISEDEQFFDHNAWSTKINKIATINHDESTDEDSKDYFEIQKL